MSVAQIYNEDIGFQGLKKKRISSTSDISFNLPIDEQEEKKRRQRMVSIPFLKIICCAIDSNQNSFSFSTLMQQRFVEHNERPKQRVQKNSVVDDSTFGKFTKSSSSKSLETNESFVGKSTALEKAYMRLTSAPKAEDVRPLPVLKMALAHVKAHFVEHEDFDFANEQLKSKFIDN